MTYDLVDGTTNVVRFPVEERARPTIELMRDIRPDVRVLLANAEAFGFQAPASDLRSLADEDTARHIQTNVARGEQPSRAFLETLLTPLVERAVTASRDALRGGRDTDRAQRLASVAVISGNAEAEWLQQRADAAALRTVEMGLIAHNFAEEAEGAARAIGLARQGEPWTSRSAVVENDDWMDGPASRREA